jgi:hypothetical protein
VSDSRGKPEPTPRCEGGPKPPTVMDKQYKPDHLGGLRRFAWRTVLATWAISGSAEQSYAQPLASLENAS